MGFLNMKLTKEDRIALTENIKNWIPATVNNVDIYVLRNIFAEPKVKKKSRRKLRNAWNWKKRNMDHRMRIWRDKSKARNQSWDFFIYGKKYVNARRIWLFNLLFTHILYRLDIQQKKDIE